MNKTPEQKRNCITSELRNMVMEADQKNLTAEDVLSYVSTILIDSGYDSIEVVKILEQPDFGEEGKEQALSIKVNEGW